MGRELILAQDLRDQLDALGRVDLVVGIPSFNNVRTIPHVVRAVQVGLAKFFPGIRAAVINSDGGSTDGTQEAVREASLNEFRPLLAAHPVYPIHRIVTPYHGIPGKGSALRTVFQAAVSLEAKACAVVDSDLRSIEPSWMDLLLSPVLREDFDFVAPLYHRHKYDGTITNSIVYPLTRSLYGQRVRQPIGGDFGFSGGLARHYLEQDVWESDVARFGIDIWMTTTAIIDGFKICQAFLGAKIHDAKDPSQDLSHMLHQVVSSVFSQMESREDAWNSIMGSLPVALFGMEHAVGMEPIRVDPDRMVRLFLTGLQELATIWEQVLRPEVFSQLRLLAVDPPAAFRFPAVLWIRILHDFAVAFHRRMIDREHLLQSLTPLYLGRLASFVRETEDLSADDVEALHEQMCLRFEALKPELIELWHSHGRTS
ncbi:MAG: cell wall biosynthesis glycosyltransferase [Holophagaceae bacterium]